MQATKNGILDPSRSEPPANIDEIRARHERARETASPTESEFEHYAHLVGGAQNEQTMLVQTAPRILKDAMKKGYSQVFNQAWTAYDKDASFSQGLSAPQPDFAEGLEYPEFLPVPVDEQLAGAVVQNDNPRSLVLPHLAGEWKGSGRDMDEAQRQAAYDGAAMVSGRNEALMMMGQTDPPRHAEVTTFATDGKQLNYYTHYATMSKAGTLQYHQYQFASENVKDSHEGHNKGRRALRNHQQRAMDNSYAMQKKLTEHWENQQRGDPLCVDEGNEGEVEEQGGYLAPYDKSDIIFGQVQASYGIEPGQPFAGTSTPTTASIVMSMVAQPVASCASTDPRSATGCVNSSGGSSHPHKRKASGTTQQDPNKQYQNSERQSSTAYYDPQEAALDAHPASYAPHPCDFDASDSHATDSYQGNPNAYPPTNTYEGY
jgi:hypothetical protein